MVVCGVRFGAFESVAIAQMISGVLKGIRFTQGMPNV
jgi:hypothetical protein